MRSTVNREVVGSSPTPGVFFATTAALAAAEHLDDGLGQRGVDRESVAALVLDDAQVEADNAQIEGVEQSVLVASSALRSRSERSGT
jgi:hypothetical protein